MTLTRTSFEVATPSRPSATRPNRPLVGRDATIDAVRAACLFVVVVLHSLMVGVEGAQGGGILTSVALEGQAWFTPVTWLLQIMPLFFIAGGFASLSQWRRMQLRGATASEYITGRVRRLAVPAIIMITAVGSVLLAAKALGADPSLVGEASLRIGQPLWFLAVYLGVTAIVPVMAWLHERYPVRTIAALGLSVIAVDLAQAQLGLPIGYLNLLLVWPLMQQLGFAMLDGALINWLRRKMLAGTAAALAVLLLLIACGWSPDMLVNLNPPTTAIALLGTAQFFVLQLLRPSIDNLTRAPKIANRVTKAGTLSMGVYLWHMPTILGLVAILWAAGMPFPEPHSWAWWFTRLPWLLLIAMCVIPLVVLISRLEIRLIQAVNNAAWQSQPRGRAASISAVLSVLLTISGVAVALLAGIASPTSHVLAVVLIGAGLAFAAVRPVSRELHAGERTDEDEREGVHRE